MAGVPPRCCSPQWCRSEHWPPGENRRFRQGRSLHRCDIPVRPSRSSRGAYRYPPGGGKESCNTPRSHPRMPRSRPLTLTGDLPVCSSPEVSSSRHRFGSEGQRSPTTTLPQRLLWRPFRCACKLNQRSHRRPAGVIFWTGLPFTGFACLGPAWLLDDEVVFDVRHAGNGGGVFACGGFLVRIIHKTKAFCRGDGGNGDHGFAGPEATILP